jgi:predicted amidophosphoribosyltransferase
VSLSCAACGADMADDARSCRSCGALISGGATEASEQLADPDRRVCLTCGGALVIGARFCHLCATKVPPLPRPARVECEGCGRQIDGTDPFCRYCARPTGVVPPEDTREAIAVDETPTTVASDEQVPDLAADDHVKPAAHQAVEPPDHEPTSAPVVPRRCGECGSEVGVDARFCRACGKPMTDAEANRRQPSGAMVACDQCGEPVESWAQFCRHCGAVTETPAVERRGDLSEP